MYRIIDCRRDNVSSVLWHKSSRVWSIKKGLHAGWMKIFIQLPVSANWKWHIDVLFALPLHFSVLVKQRDLCDITASPKCAPCLETCWLLIMQDGPRGGDVWNVQRSPIWLQGWHLVPGGDSDRAGTDRAAKPWDESHEGAAENSQVWAAHTHAPLSLVRCCTGDEWERPSWDICEA